MAYFEVKSKPRLTFPTLTGSIVTFNSQYAGLPLKSHKIALTATQSGSGTPSPSNPRPITGYSAINISHSDADISNPTVYTIQIGSTVYGGTYDAITGVMTVDKSYSSKNGSEGWVVRAEDNDLIIFSLALAVPSVLNELNQISNIFTYDSNAWRLVYGSGNTFTQGTSRTLYVKCFKSDFADITAFKTFLGNTNLQYVYNVSPTTIQLPPCPIDTLEGVNNIWADTGDTTLQYPKFG